MKKHIIRYISVILMMIVALTTVLQFHHHDCDGNIYIHLTTFDDLSLGANHHAIEHCQHNHDNEHRDCNGGKDCSMHLGVFTVSKQNECKYCHHHHDESIHGELFVWINPFSALNHPIEEHLINEFELNDNELIISRLLCPSMPFRAPPVSMI